LRWWLQRQPLEDFVDDPEAKLAVEVARVLAPGPSLTSFDLAGLQGSLDWARSGTRAGTNQTMAERRRAHAVLHLLGQIHVVLNGAPTVGAPWNFVTTASDAAHQSSSVEAMLRDAIGLWRTSPHEGTRELAAASTDLLVLGYDSPSLALLAGIDPLASRFEVVDLVSQMLDEFGVAYLLDGSAERAGLEVRLRRLIRGRIPLRDVSSWAHRWIGHDGADELQPFVLLDDIYDDWEHAGLDLAYLEKMARHAANDFLAGRPVTRLDYLEPKTPQPVGDQRGGRGWRDRLRFPKRPD